VHRFKFADLSSLAGVMAASMAAMVDWQVDAVVPVPLTPPRERQRGYNQSRLLAKVIAERIDAPLLPALRRRGHSHPQARSQSAEERRRNVRDAFEARTSEPVSGLGLLLVDDVATTGATLDACARALLSAGAREVTAVTFARED
jgi:ComF family protein